MERESSRLTAACSCPGSRRGFLTGLAALAASPLVTSCATTRTAASRDRIDIHHHMFAIGAAMAEAEIPQLGNRGMRVMRRYTERVV